MAERLAVDVVGSSVASLAAAERLSADGIPVHLYSTGTPGGVFAGIDLGGRRVEAGVRRGLAEVLGGELLRRYVEGDVLDAEGRETAYSYRYRSESRLC